MLEDVAAVERACNCNMLCAAILMIQSRIYAHVHLAHYTCLRCFMIKHTNMLLMYTQVDDQSEGGTGVVIGGSRGSLSAARTSNSSSGNVGSSGNNSSATMSGNGGVDKRIRMFSLHGNAAAASMLLQVRHHFTNSISNQLVHNLMLTFYMAAHTV
jgi:hypothetical protein